MDRNKATLQTWNQLAAAYQDKFMNLDLYNDTYDAFCDLIQKSNARVFEIGCGPGNITRYILAKRPDLQVTAIDTAPNMIALAQKNNPSANCKIMDAREIDKIQDQFDAVLCGFCMPYLSKQENAKLIKDCASLLLPGGIFYSSTIEGDYQQSGYETSSNGEHQMFVYYHQQDYLQEELKANSFEVVDLTRKHFPKPDGTVSTHLIIISRKKKRFRAP